MGVHVCVRACVCICTGLIRALKQPAVSHCLSVVRHMQCVPPPLPPPPPPGSGGVETAVIIGVVVAVAMAILIIIIITVFATILVCMKHKTKSE